jgi:hypothetical protein
MSSEQTLYDIVNEGNGFIELAPVDQKVGRTVTLQGFNMSSLETMYRGGFLVGKALFLARKNYGS